jgi:hypothetical protein
MKVLPKPRRMPVGVCFFGLVHSSKDALEPGGGNDKVSFCLGPPMVVVTPHQAPPSLRQTQSQNEEELSLSWSKLVYTRVPCVTLEYQQSTDVRHHRCKPDSELE